MARRNQPPSIHVVLDTNCLFTEAADKLICTDVSGFILNDSRHLGLNITWHLPSLVKAERKFQMMERGKRLLPALAKVETLLGHALGINEAVLDSRVDDAIRRQMEQHQLVDLDLITEKVDWPSIINAAARRLPPFDAGEKEKGFRDALILEAFSQLAEAAPKSQATARIVLLSSDKLLQIAARERFQDRANVLVADGLDEIRTMLNAVASQLTQEVIGEILPKAKKLFFTSSENRETLYYKSEVAKKIEQQFGAQYLEPPEPGCSTAKLKTVLIGNPTFLSKTNQRLFLSSKVTHGIESIKQVWSKESNEPPMGLLSGIAVQQPPSAEPVGLLGLGSATIQSYLKEFKHTGTATFEVFWSVTLNKRGALSNPQLEKVELRSVSWEP